MSRGTCKQCGDTECPVPVERMTQVVKQELMKMWGNEERVSSVAEQGRPGKRRRVRLRKWFQDETAGEMTRRQFRSG